MPSPKYFRSAVRGLRDFDEPTTGELDTAINICRSNREPDAGMGYKLKLTPYYDTFCKWKPAPQKTLYSTPLDAEATDIFTIRFHPSMPKIETRDYVVKGDEYFRVAATRVKGRRNNWLEIWAAPHFENSSPMDISVASPPIEVEDSAPSDSPITWNS